MVENHAFPPLPNTHSLAAGRPSNPPQGQSPTPYLTGSTHSVEGRENLQSPSILDQLQGFHGFQQAISDKNQPPLSPRALKKSFLSIAARNKPFAILSSRDPITYKDRPAAAFFEDEIQKLAQPFVHSIIGKFSCMPKLQEIRQAFKGIGLTGAYAIRWLDYKHILIHLSNEQDFNWIWTKQQWFIVNQKMRVFKWSLDFEVERESSIVLVWISFPNLKVHLYEKSTLLLIAKTVGKPLFIAEATTNGSRPSVAQVCVEYDCRNAPVEEVWIVIKNRVTRAITGGYAQRVEFSKMPDYYLLQKEAKRANSMMTIQSKQSKKWQPVGKAKTIGVKDVKGSTIGVQDQRKESVPLSNMFGALELCEGNDQEEHVKQGQPEHLNIAIPAQNTVAATNQAATNLAAAVSQSPDEGREINGSGGNKVIQTKDLDNTPLVTENAQQRRLEIVFDCVATSGTHEQRDEDSKKKKIQKTSLVRAVDATLHGTEEQKLMAIREVVETSPIGGEGTLVVRWSASRPSHYVHGEWDPMNKVTGVREKELSETVEGDGMSIKNSEHAEIMLEGSGKHNSMNRQGDSQTRGSDGHNRVDSTVACPRDRTKGYDDNPPNLESALVKGNNHAELQVHPRERHKRHSDSAVPFLKTVSSTTKDAIVMGGNEGDSDEDSISISFAAKNHPAAIKASTIEFFFSLMKKEQCDLSRLNSSIIPALVSAADNNFLCAAPTLQEDILADDLFAAVLDFFQGMCLPRGITSTTLILLPKKSNASAWSDFRPISLCNVLNKIITKLLANWLAKLLPSIITENQSGFWWGFSWTAYERGTVTQLYNYLQGEMLDEVSPEKPLTGEFKLNVDGSSKYDCQRAVGGGLLRDHTGTLIFGFVENFGPYNSLQAELMALYRGLLLCIEHNVRRLWIEMDAKVVISHIHREGNQAVDLLSNQGYMHQNLHVFSQAEG
ncbi:Uncharacterized protein TCM_012582 [Theobroma cacao]|uniref:RNase H type-1 domain-containing protein n=1 Tax=Theobroma cacao TaxID=3641 RepID=A0A061FVW7_THECC|nr:Uncharacterized protein TCM_012582 [Theobroma cacao]